jgi:parallel beta-helix repeat protein
MPATCIAAWESGADIVIRGNVIHGCPNEKGIDTDARNTALIEGNDIWVKDLPADAKSDGWTSGRPAIEVYGNGPRPITIRDNDLHDSLIGILVSGGAPTLDITGNRIHDDGVGVSGVGVSAELAPNRIERNATGVVSGSLGTPTLDGNTLSDNEIGVSIGSAATPVLAGNTICGNVTDLVSPRGDPVDTAGSEICEDPPADQARLRGRTRRRAGPSATRPASRVEPALGPTDDRSTISGERPLWPEPVRTALSRSGTTVDLRRGAPTWSQARVSQGSYGGRCDRVRG